jgi:hypothetical protein
MLYWKVKDELKYGSMEDLYCSYVASDDKQSYKVLSAKGNLDNAKIDFERISDVAYHGIKPVYKVTLKDGTFIKVTKDHCLYGTKDNEMTAQPTHELTNVVTVNNLPENKDFDNKLLSLSLKDIQLIEPVGLEPVYDVVGVENTERFVANGMLISNSGNEISIFKREVADQLGLNLATGQDFNVAGINGPGRAFKKFKLWIKIGNLQPVQATIGFAVNPGDLVENLLGNADIVKSGKFQVTYDANGVTYTQKAMHAKVSNGSDAVSEQEVLNNLYEHQTTRRKRYEKTEPDEHDGCNDHNMNSVGGYGIFY